MVRFSSLLAAFVSLLVVALPTFAEGDTLTNARDATAVYADPAAALAGGYELLTDASGLACIDEPGMGAMGVHFVKGALVEKGTVDPARPQALVYERQADGRLSLVAVEYVVIQQGWDAAHSAPPSLFGQSFPVTQAGNRYGLPAFYALHAWVGKDNPLGAYSSWNPDVHCGVNGNANQANESTTHAAVDLVCALPE